MNKKPLAKWKRVFCSIEQTKSFQSSLWTTTTSLSSFNDISTHANPGVSRFANIYLPRFVEFVACVHMITGAMYIFDCLIIYHQRCTLYLSHYVSPSMATSFPNPSLIWPSLASSLAGHLLLWCTKNDEMFWHPPGQENHSGFNVVVLCRCRPCLFHYQKLQSKFTWYVVDVGFASLFEPMIVVFSPIFCIVNIRSNCM